jgi:hypothetical protein
MERAGVWSVARAFSKTAVCEKSGGLPGVVAETCFLVATALRHALHSPEAPYLMRLLVLQL